MYLSIFSCMQIEMSTMMFTKNRKWMYDGILCDIFFVIFVLLLAQIFSAYISFFQ